MTIECTKKHVVDLKYIRIALQQNRKYFYTQTTHTQICPPIHNLTTSIRVYIHTQKKQEHAEPADGLLESKNTKCGWSALTCGVSSIARAHSCGCPYDGVSVYEFTQSRNRTYDIFVQQNHTNIHAKRRIETASKQPSNRMNIGSFRFEFSLLLTYRVPIIR